MGQNQGRGSNTHPKSYYDQFTNWDPTVRSFESCIKWLYESNLAIPAKDNEKGETNPTIWSDIRQDIKKGIPVYRRERPNADHIKGVKERYLEREIPGTVSDKENAARSLLDDYYTGAKKIGEVEIDPVPPDAIACYRPFHIDPGSWGIYISVNKLMEYVVNLCKVFSGKIFVFGNLESIASCVLFEVFNHEFFHHIVESMATALEILSAAYGPPKPIYWDYFRDSYEELLGVHPFKPLEEALANAYAYNSFSFISRVKLGYKCIQAKVYQSFLEKVYSVSGKGYDGAFHYCGTQRESNYVSGGAQLISMMLRSDKIDPFALMLLSDRVMPRGHTAFLEKPFIPTYLIGTQQVIEKLLKLIPCPTETYTSLFWPGDTSKIDEAIRELKKINPKKEKESKDNIYSKSEKLT